MSLNAGECLQRAAREIVALGGPSHARAFRGSQSNRRRLTVLALSAFLVPSATSFGQEQAGPAPDVTLTSSATTSHSSEVAAAGSATTSTGAGSDPADLFATSPADGTGDSKPQTTKPPRRPDLNADIFYENKVEFSLESGALPINLPFVFDVFVGGDYAQNPLHYTAVPVFPSVRWQMGDVHGPWFLRGNTDMTFTWSVTAFPRGPEKIYDALDLGFRYNFVQRNWRVTPYFEVRVGGGFIDAQEPYGNAYAQGQDLTFTLMTGTGFRYNFNSRYSMAIGATYFHVSNAYLSEPKYDDNGINVCGPLVGFNVRLSKPKEH